MEQFVRFGGGYPARLNDNSVKPDSDLSFADLACFAGSPEWWNELCDVFYQRIISASLPSLFLGLGTAPESLPEFKQEVLDHSIAVTVRDPALLSSPVFKKVNAQYIPCPALMSAKSGTEKHIRSVTRIGLVFMVGPKDSVPNNCAPDIHGESLYYADLFLHIIERFGNDYEFVVICHYIDELAVANRLFGGLRGVRICYSFDAMDYFEIYRQCDLTVSTRVHGCGISSSLGIPSFILSHDFRGATAKGFRSHELRLFTPFSEAEAMLKDVIASISDFNSELVSWKQETEQKYLSILMGMPLSKVHYQSRADISQNISYEEIQTCSKVQHARFYLDKFDFHINDGWLALDIAGWGFDEDDPADGGRWSLVLESSNQFYLIALNSDSRPDVSECFHSTLSNLGFSLQGLFPFDNEISFPIRLYLLNESDKGRKLFDLNYTIGENR